MRLKSAALFAVCFLFVSFWLHGGARCQSSVASPLSLAAPVTDQGSPPAARCYWSGLNWWCSSPPGPGVLPPRPRAKGSPPMAPEVPMYPPPVVLAAPPSVTAKGSSPTATKNVSPPVATDDVPARTAAAKRSPPPAAKNVSPPAATEDGPARTATAKGSSPTVTKNVSPPVATDDGPARTATAKRSPPTAAKNVSPAVATDDVPARTATAKGSARLAAAKNSPPPANAEDARAPAIGKLSPSREPGPDGLIVVIDDDEETGQPLPIRPRPAKQSKVRQKPDTTEGRSADDAEVEKLKTKLIICRGC
jgi:hypothetical protein